MVASNGEHPRPVRRNPRSRSLEDAAQAAAYHHRAEDARTTRAAIPRVPHTATRSRMIHKAMTTRTALSVAVAPHPVIRAPREMRIGHRRQRLANPHRLEDSGRQRAVGVAPTRRLFHTGKVEAAKFEVDRHRLLFSFFNSLRFHRRFHQRKPKC